MFVDRPVGIDLGTTNSEIALCHPSESRIYLYADRFGRKTMPSAVAWDPKSAALLVGHAARARRTKGGTIIESIKRKMGQTTRTEVGPHALLPEEISAAILKELRTRFAEFLATEAASGSDVEMRVARATITVPAYFDAPQVEATRRAAEQSGLEVLSILQEPTAAAIHATWKHRLGDGTFLVYDLGGGTFDVSVVRCLGGEYQVLAIDGDNYLGGDDLDRRFAERLRLDLVKRGYALELDVRQNTDDALRWSKLVHLAQEVKESLSMRDVVHVSKQDIFDDQGGESVGYDAEIGRAEYEGVVGSLIDTTLACCERALEKSRQLAGVGIDGIDHVLLVGGSTRVPLVVRKVTELLAEKCKNAKPLQDDVDTCVALGAAIHAAHLGGLRIGDAEKKARVSFVSPLAGEGKQLRLGLRVEEAPEGARTLAVRADGQPLASTAFTLAENVRLDVPLGANDENPTTLALVDANGTTLSELAFALYRVRAGEARPRASALSRPSVVAKDIALEVVRAGRRERRVLLSHGTGLPAKVKREFFTVDQSGRVVLRLLQERLPIKTLVLEVPPETKVGSRVELELSCDESMRMEARAEVAGQELWALVEAPSAVRYEKVEAILALLDEAEEAGRTLWGAFGQAYHRECERLTSSIRELLAIDPDKCDAHCQKLRLLIDEFRGGEHEAMTPPMHRFEQVLDTLRRIVFRATGPLVGMDRAQWEERLTRITEEATRAYETSDGPAWRRLFNELQALVETAYQEELSTVRHDDPTYVARRFASVFAWASRLELDLEDFQPSTAEEVRGVQLAEKERLVAWLREKCSRPLAAASGGERDVAETRRTLEQVASELERIQAALERIPSIGLVTDRGSR